MSRTTSLLALVLTLTACGKSGSDAGATAKAEPSPSATAPSSAKPSSSATSASSAKADAKPLKGGPTPLTVPFVPCQVTIPADSEIGEAKESGFWVKVQGGQPMFDPSVLIVNSPISMFDKTIDPGATKLKFKVEEKRDDGYALEGELEKQGKKYYFVDRSIPCAPKAWLHCRMVAQEQKDAEYASRVCRSLVAKK
jgi:hypothetical protein